MRGRWFYVDNGSGNATRNDTRNGYAYRNNRSRIGGRSGWKGRAMTIKDVAAYCGVSVSTVSRVLNNHPDVSDEVRNKVMKAVSDLHYTPNSTARDLARAQVNAIGLVVRGISNPFFTPIIRAIEHGCEAAGYTMVLHQVSTTDDEVRAATELVQSKRLNGVIFLGGRYDYTEAEMQGLTVPYVCCTYTNHFGNLDRSSYSSVAIDDKAEAERAVKYLISRGHRRIAILLDNPEDHSISERRYAGYCKALCEAGIGPDPDLVLEAADFDLASSYRCVKDFADRREDFTALFAVADTLAIAAIKALYDAGKRVPDDVSVIAIDGIEISNYLIPTLTTLCQPKDRLGEEAVRILVDVLEGRAGNRHIRLETTPRLGGTVKSL